MLLCLGMLCFLRHTKALSQRTCNQITKLSMHRQSSSPKHTPYPSALRCCCSRLKHAAASWPCGACASALHTIAEHEMQGLPTLPIAHQRVITQKKASMACSEPHRQRCCSIPKHAAASLPSGVCASAPHCKLVSILVYSRRTALYGSADI